MQSTYFYGPGRDGGTDYVTAAPAWAGTFKFYLTAGIAIATASTSSVPVLYNPAVPTVVGTVWAPLVTLRIMAVRIGITVGSSMVVGTVRYGLANGTTFSSTATTNSGSVNTFVGRGAATPAGWYTTATASAAPTIDFPANFNAGGSVGSGKGVVFTMIDNIGGSIVLPPGGSFWPFLSTGAGTPPTFTAMVTVDVVQTPYLASY
jgi:hypothetical protein